MRSQRSWRGVRRIVLYGSWTCALAMLVAMRPSAMAAQPSGNLVVDPGFESGTGLSDFSVQQAGSVIARTTDNPISGDASLRVVPEGWGANIWWGIDYTGGRASGLHVSGHLRSDLASASTLRFCANVYYTDWSIDESCADVSGEPGDKGVVSADVAVDAEKPLMWVNIRITQDGSEPLQFMLDDAAAYLDVVSPPEPGGGGDPGGGDPGDPGDPGNPGPSCSAGTGVSGYQPLAYQPPAARPFLPLTMFTQGGANTPTAIRIRHAADLAIAGDAPYAFAPLHAILAYRLTNDPQYLADAIARVDAFVTDFEASIAAGEYPAIAGDSYLEIGWYLENLSVVYDHGYEQLTVSQRQRWEAIANQATYNLWHPSDATWGDKAFPWTGWSVCDPGNNYHFSFLRASMTWALASQNTEQIAFLQTQKFPALLDYYAALPGGGTREGTGYGSALGNLLGDYLYWKAATGEDLANVTAHPRETIDYWVHATVPTLDRFAPIADLSRESIPNIYDYQESLIHEAVVLSAGTPQARRGTWWLQHNSVPSLNNFLVIANDLLPYPDPAEAPADLMYHSPGAGALFARTSWNTDAAWMAFVAGKFDQSHAHQDQGSFTFFKNDWLAVTNNIWSHSGLHQEVEAHNTLRFELAGGDVVSQNQSATLASSMTPSHDNGATTVVADLTHAYSAHASSIQAWTRTLVLSGDTLRVTDACTVASGVTPIFQLQVPAAPVLQADGTILAGHLRVTPMAPVTAAFVPMNGAEFSRGFRIDLRAASGGCAFDVLLEAVPNAAPDPDPDPDPDPGPGPDPTPQPDPNGDPIEAVWSENGPAAARIKSPAQHMRFTAGAPLRILADARDPNAWMCPPGHPPYVCPGTLVRFSVDGQLAGTATPSPTDMNLWEMRLPGGLPAGDHVLTVSYVPYNPSSGGGGTAVAGLAPVTIHVDAAPSHATTIALTEDVVLDGSADLDWTDATIVGNGFTVRSAPGYSGHVAIRNSRITGLGSYTSQGIAVTTSGAIAIEDSIFEATGGMRFGAQGTAAFTVRNNELRANNLLTYVASNPDVPVGLELAGSTAGAKTIQGNRVGAGILRVRGDGWQIGGTADGEGNVLIGPRVVLELIDSSNDVIQGNYLHHDYHGGFSQGFNLVFAGSSDHALIEHNVIRGGSWPVQTVGGEFRYNLVIDSGHNFWRSATSGTGIHHNVFSHASGTNTGYEGALKLYGGETGLSLYNNTFDAGGALGANDGPAFNIGPSSSIASIRNSLFVGFSTTSGYGGALVGAPEGAVASPRVTSADYNGWFNPLAASARYLAGIVANTPGLHDVIANPRWSGQPDVPYRVSEGCIWSGGCRTRQVLERYRETYRPAPGSPMIGAGDPSDGPGSFIGAIGPDDSHPLDRFGRVGGQQ